MLERPGFIPRRGRMETAIYVLKGSIRARILGTSQKDTKPEEDSGSHERTPVSHWGKGR